MHAQAQLVIAEANPVRGNTWPVRAELKKLGCVWNPDAKAWFAPTPELQRRAQSLIPAYTPRRPAGPCRCSKCGKSIQTGNWCGCF